MKIAFAIRRLERDGGGAQLWTLGYARYLAERGHDVHLLAVADAGIAEPGTLHRLEPGPDVLGRAAARPFSAWQWHSTRGSRAATSPAGRWPAWRDAGWISAWLWPARPAGSR